MLQSYDDITLKLGTPLWWDEVGCPRYEQFEPQMCNNIYADEAVLLLIACQNCRHEMQVAMSLSMFERIQHGVKEMLPELHERIMRGGLHYGDPPCSECASGPTMNCDDLKILEYWYRNQGTRHEWTRNSKFEVELPDTYGMRNSP